MSATKTAPVGALTFIRHSLAYGSPMPQYRHREANKSQAFVFADAKDAAKYAAENNLVVVHEAERVK